MSWLLQGNRFPNNGKNIVTKIKAYTAINGRTITVKFS